MWFKRKADLPFRNRCEAGRFLAERLHGYAGRDDVIVLGLPRGGVPAAYEVAKSLGLPLDVFVVRKLGAPGREELAMGAIASGNVRVLNDDVVAMLRDPERELALATARERCELERCEAEYRAGRPALDLRGKTAILIDDGLATGATMRAAIVALRQRGVAACVVAVPVAAADTCAELRSLADEIICAAMPAPFYGVGWFYEDFSQVSDAEVCDLLGRATALIK